MPDDVDLSMGLTARGYERMDLESDAFIDRLFDTWLEGHFGKRLDRVEQGDLDATTQTIGSEVRDEALLEAPPNLEENLLTGRDEALLETLPRPGEEDIGTGREEQGR